MPVIAALGGNAGMQTLTVVVRALAMQEITRGNAQACAQGALAVGFERQRRACSPGPGRPDLVRPFDLALVFGVGRRDHLGRRADRRRIPLVLDRLGFDPAVASSVFVTPTIDAIGFFTFLGLAALLLL